MPALSTNTNLVPYHSASVDTLSRVVPGVSETIAMRLPARRLNKVDLPTFGRPTMAIIGKAMAGIRQLSGQLMLQRAQERTAMASMSAIWAHILFSACWYTMEAGC